MHDELRLGNQVCFRLYSAARLLMQAYTPFLNELGITYPQYLVLMVLWEKDAQPVNDIAHKLLLETNTVTPLLQRMEKAGLIARTQGKEDSRQRIVSLTKKGIELRERAKHIPECLTADIIKNEGSPEEITQMIPTLDKLIAGLKQTEKNL